MVLLWNCDEGENGKISAKLVKLVNECKLNCFDNPLNCRMLRVRSLNCVSFFLSRKNNLLEIDNIEIFKYFLLGNLSALISTKRINKK